MGRKGAILRLRRRRCGRDAILGIFILLLGHLGDLRVLNGDLVTRSSVGERSRAAVALIQFFVGGKIILSGRRIGHLVIGGATGSKRNNQNREDVAKDSHMGRLLKEGKGDKHSNPHMQQELNATVLIIVIAESTIQLPLKKLIR